MSNKRIKGTPVTQSGAIAPKADASPDDLEGLMNDLKSFITLFCIFFHTGNLTNAQRKRLMGSGTRRYGLMDKVSDLAETFPQYNPALYDNELLKEKLRDIEYLRDMLALVIELARIITNNLLTEGDEGYRIALEYYNSVNRLSNAGDPGAIAVFEMLEPFFRRRKGTSAEPTVHQLDRDVKALIKGTKEGEIILKNTGTKVIEGERTVVDNTHKPDKAKFKETESGEVDE